MNLRVSAVCLRRCARLLQLGGFSAELGHRLFSPAAISPRLLDRLGEKCFLEFEQKYRKTF